jgi:hypothetical protein
VTTAGKLGFKMLTAIKLLHTLIWAVMAAGIVTLPISGVLRRFRWASILTAMVLVECAVLALNDGRCPLTDIAAGFTIDRSSNFDIYLPEWLAVNNKMIFGWLFVAGELVVLGSWLRERYAVLSRNEISASDEGRQ